MLPKVTFRVQPAQKINIRATLKKLKNKNSHITSQDELAQAIFKRKDLMEIAEGSYQRDDEEINIPGFEGTRENLAKIKI